MTRVNPQRTLGLCPTPQCQNSPVSGGWSFRFLCGCVCTIAAPRPPATSLVNMIVKPLPLPPYTHAHTLPLPAHPLVAVWPRAPAWPDVSLPGALVEATPPPQVRGGAGRGGAGRVGGPRRGRGRDGGVIPVFWAEQL